MYRASASRANASHDGSDPILDEDQEYITQGQQWRSQQDIRQRFKRIERRIDDQFDDAHKDMILVGQLWEDTKASIAKLGHRRHDKSSSTSRDGRTHHHNGHRPHHHRHARSPRRHNKDDIGDPQGHQWRTPNYTSCHGDDELRQDHRNHQHRLEGQAQ